ncbi:MAG: choice-of-anchor D domain-containing protein, partial [Candidatus Sulfotelmatobacter sp.]
MKRSPGRWIAIPALLALASMLGCQGLSVGKSSTSVVTGSVTGILAAAPASVSFGNVPIGVTQSQNDVLTNTGSSTVMVTQEMVSGASFSTTGLSFPLTLAPQQTASFQIVFSPTASGSVNGTLALANDGSTGSVNIAVSGTGTAPGSLTTNPTSFNFGTVAIGSSQIQTETVKNTGGQNLTISAASISSSFALSGLTLPLTLAPNQSSSFGIVFAPGTSGPISGILSLTVGGSSTYVDVALSGTGVLPGTLTASPTSVTFTNIQVGQNQTQTETVENTGGANVTISGSTASGTGFSISGISTPLTLTPGQSTSFNVVLTPPSAGNFSGSVSITSDASNPSLNIALSGTAVSPATLTATPTSLAFTSVPVGQSQTQTETVKNTGGVNATISAATASGTGFSVSGISTPLTLIPGQSTSFSVSFTPSTAGSFSGSVSITSDASNPSLTIPVSGSSTVGTLSVSSPVAVGNVVVGASGTATGTLTASGASVTVSTVGLGGTNPGEFAISGVSFPVTVTTSTPVPFTVTFTPGASGTASATASFASNASNTPSLTSLTGTGTAAVGTLSVSSPVAVGNVVVGSSGTVTGTLTAGGASVTVSSVSLGGTNPGEFAISGVSFPVTVTTST